MDQWYRINTNKITNSHIIANCNDTTINMVPLPPAEPSESNAFETIVRLSLLQNQRDLIILRDQPLKYLNSN